MDYESLVDEIVQFEQCQRRSCVHVVIVYDKALEITELFDVHLDRTSDLDDRIELNPVNAAVEITDNDGIYNIVQCSQR